MRVYFLRTGRTALTALVIWTASFLVAVAEAPPGGGAATDARVKPTTISVNVRDAGATGDGTTDDWPAFRDAIARIAPGGGTLRVPPGDYRLSRELAIDRGDIAVECEGRARLVVGGLGVKLLHFRGDRSRSGRIENIRVTGCRFWDPAPLSHANSEESHGIVLVNVDRATLRDLEFVDMGDESVDIIFSTEVRLLDSYARGGCAAVTHPHAGTFSVNGSSRVQIRGNVIDQNANGAAIRVEVNPGSPRSDHVIIAENQIFSPRDRGNVGLSSGTGIMVNPANDDSTVITILGNQIIDPYRYGIVVHPVFAASSAAFVIHGNTVVGGGEGISGVASPNHGAIVVVGQAALGAITGNVVQGWGSPDETHAGIRVGGRGVAVVGNAVADVAGPGIDARSSQGQGNTVVGNLLPATGGVAFQPGNLSGLNHSDGAGSVRLELLRGCRSISTSAEGQLICNP